MTSDVGLDLVEACVTSVLGEEAGVLALLSGIATDASRSDTQVYSYGFADGVDHAASVTFEQLISILDAGDRTPPRRVVLIGPETQRERLHGLVERAHAMAHLGLVVAGATEHAELILVVRPGRGPARFARETETRRDQAPQSSALAPVEIAILGPVEIRGSEGSFQSHPVLTELVVYLALHPEGSLSRSWAAALWPERQVPEQTISNRLSEARRLLGTAPDRLPRLRRDADRQHLADVTTDWARFQELNSRPDDPDAWHEALALVRGRPLIDLAQGEWADLEGITGEIERVVVDAALRLGTRVLADGDPDEASWAAQMGLRCAPWDERLHRLLMRAADAAGNRSGVDQILRRLALVLEIDGDPLRGVHPQTAALYQELSEGAARV